MAKDRGPSQPNTTPRKRQHAVVVSDDESPNKKIASDTTRTNSSSPLGDSISSHGSPLRTLPPEMRRSLPAHVDEEIPDVIPTHEPNDIKVETNSRAGTANPGISLLGEHITKLIDLIITLRDNGVERLALELPQIVVVGDQSTGKSSLIEGLSAIKVPRDEGTCTRCPIEINLKGVHGGWHCRISIVKRYAYRVGPEDSNPSLGFGPFNKELSPAIVEHFADVTDKREIPTWLARAQLAVLNPRKSIKAFAVPPHQDIETSTTQEPFAPNVIRLEISAPGLPSLSFFDLPGVVVQDVDMDSHVPTMIRNLVKTYITSSKSLVLLTLPIDNDRANSSAAELVFRAKAQDRTIGIISKPDRLVHTNVQQWKEILAGEKFQFNLGYRVIKNPADPSIDHAEARRQERHFFNTNKIFCEELAMFQDRFGTEKLKGFLSEHLMTMIIECLPEIEEKIADRVNKIGKQLEKIPKPPSGNIFIDIQQRLLNFERQLSEVINNSINLSGNPGWFEQWHKTAQTFFEKLIRTAPQLDTTALPATAPMSSSKSQRTNGDVITVDDDSDSGSARQVSTRRIPTHQTLMSAILPDSFDDLQRHQINTTVSRCTKKFTVLQLRNYIHAVNGGVYGIADPRVFELLVKESTAHWFEVCKEFLQWSVKLCEQLIDELLRKLFEDLIKTELFQVINESVKQFLKRLNKKQQEISKRLCRIEFGKPFTLDCEIQENSKHSVREQLTEQLQRAACRKRLQEMANAGGRVGEAEKKRIIEQVKSQPNHHYQELNELAGAIAYYKIAARRFADNNCLTMRNEFFHDMIESLWRRISSDIGISHDTDPIQVNEHLKKLTAPSTQDAKKRRELEYELELLAQTREDVMNVVKASQPNMDDSDEDSVEDDEMET